MSPEHVRSLAIMVGVLWLIGYGMLRLVQDVVAIVRGVRR